MIITPTSLFKGHCGVPTEVCQAQTCSSYVPFLIAPLAAHPACRLRGAAP